MINQTNGASEDASFLVHPACYHMAVMNMKYRRIKKYAIHILSVSALNHSVVDVSDEEGALIILTKKTTPFIESTRMRKVIVDIQDVNDEKAIGAFAKEDAQSIISFIRDLPEKVTDLYVCCSEGESRSPGCAAALMLMSGRSDKDVWRNPFYSPNSLVFSTLCKEFGILMPPLFVWIRKVTNSRSFHAAQKKRSSGKYERWQILW